MKPIQKLTQNFLDMLQDKIDNGSSSLNSPLIFKKMEILLNHAEDARDVKLILLKFLDDDKCKNTIRAHINKKYPHLKDTLDKMLILK